MEPFEQLTLDSGNPANPDLPAAAQSPYGTDSQTVAGSPHGLLAQGPELFAHIALPIGSELQTVAANSVDLYPPRLIANTPAPPVITDFGASEGPNGIWTFSGVVVAADPSNLMVRFGGLPTLEGQTIETNPDGTFQFSIRLRTGEDGMVTAQTTDSEGQDSNIAEVYIHQTNGFAGHLQT
jgi:hypothetical protein